MINIIKLHKSGNAAIVDYGNKYEHRYYVYDNKGNYIFKYRTNRK